MTLSTRREWSTEFTAGNQRRSGDAYRSSRSTITFHGEHPLAQLQPGETRQTQEMIKEEQRNLSRGNRPSTGRTTALGRRVEKPADVKPAGPSGQRDRGQYDRKHANK